MVKSETLAAAAASLLLIPAANAIYTKQSPVLQVDHRTYPDLITKSNYTSIVEFYAPWCGHCQNLKPAYEKAAKSLTGLAKVAAIDCNEEDNKPFCGQMGVQGFPTLKIVRPGKKAGKPTTEDYQGARTAKGIVDAVLDKVPNHVKRLKDADYAAWVAEDGPKAILFTDKGTVSALLKAVAIDFLGVLNVGQIRNKETEAVEAFGVEEFPTLVLLPGGGKDPITYDGELKKDAIVKFLSKAATPNPDPAPKQKKEKSSKTDKAKVSSASSKFAKSSASQASEQAETDPAGTKTDETIIDDPTYSPNPQIHAKKPAKVSEAGIESAKPIKSLLDGLSLQQKCLNTKAGTCILALLPEEDVPSEKTIQAIMTLSELHHKHESGGRNLFPFYQLPHTNSQAAALRTKLELSPSDVEVIAINGKRSWWRYYSSMEFTMKKVEDWVDAIRMGDSKKLDVPSGLIADAASLPPEPVELDDEVPPPRASKAAETDPELERLKEQMKGTMPEGMDFEIEEIDDDEYERIMNQQGKEEKPVDHDEL